MIRSVPGSQQPLVLACVDVEGKLNLEERRGKYRLRSCDLDLLHAGGQTGALFPANRDQSGPKGCQATLPRIRCKSVQPVPSWIDEPFSLVRQSSSGSDTRSRLFPDVPARESKAVETDFLIRCVFRRRRRQRIIINFHRKKLIAESKGKTVLNLSPKAMIACNVRGLSGCRGGQVDRAWNYLRKYGYKYF